MKYRISILLALGLVSLKNLQEAEHERNKLRDELALYKNANRVQAKVIEEQKRVVDAAREAQRDYNFSHLGRTHIGPCPFCNLEDALRELDSSNPPEDQL